MGHHLLHLNLTAVSSSASSSSSSSSSIISSNSLFPCNNHHQVPANSFHLPSHLKFSTGHKLTWIQKLPRIATTTIKCSAKTENASKVKLDCCLCFYCYCGLILSFMVERICLPLYIVSSQSSATVKEKSVSVILLAGGKGKRMGASMPKQYLPLLGQPIALYSLYTFSKMIEVKEIVVVCDPSYQDVFEDAKENINVDLKFALPGKERQDSVYSGLQAVDSNSELVCVHDSARPLVSSADIEKVLKDAWVNGAAVLGVPVKATIKEANSDSFVVRTLDRRTLWEMHTPQVIKPELLKKGFELVNRDGLEVTDDVSIVEHLKHPVFITEGSYTNIKVTTPDDLLLAERILNMDS